MTTQFSPEEKDCIYHEFIVQQVPIERIMQDHGFADADLVYDVLAGHDVRMPGFTLAQQSATGKVYDAFSIGKHGVSDVVVSLVGDRPLRVCELGSGRGDHARMLIDRIPRATLVAIELSESHHRHALSHNRMDRLEFVRGDATALALKDLDVIFHTNMFEHVSDPEKFFLASVEALKEGGSLIFTCPTKGYWMFWGWPKYIASLMLRRRFEFHGISEWDIGHWTNRAGLVVVERRFFGFIWPRRVFKYFSSNMILSLGSLFQRLESWMPESSFFQMFQYWHVVKPGETPPPAPDYERPRPLLNRMLLPLTLPIIVVLLLFSNAIMTWEVIRGRKTFFRQG